MHAYEILRRPVLTEKSNLQADYLGQYTFEVDRRANKHQVKKAVEEVFNVQVVAVNIVNMPAKMGRYGRRRVVRIPAWKKAIVTLAPGQRIEIFEGV
ncbi:MAG: 50S ribosomal protein L23 [Anaerolineae bacterium]|jgi:large subunit ribosomal protein L23|nr:50S ribosomal protein L23 [Anaerolineae bacterium]MDH7473487.1 50S ribosomal protein L23 [Anaerolineae bacterium]